MSTEHNHRASFRSLSKWYSPYLKGSRKALVVGLALTTVMLACQAIFPLVMETLLHHGHWGPLAYWLIGIMMMQLIAGYFAHIFGHGVAISSAERLREHVFKVTLNGTAMDRQNLVRSSVVSRLTTDVDNIGDALEKTLNYGLPGVSRVIISLALLTYIEWHAGVAMIFATIAFLTIRRSLGRRLMVLDYQKLHESNQIGESVDEAITSARIISGLQLTTWITNRFTRRNHAYQHSSHEQGIAIARLATGAHAAGLAGLLFVVLFGITSGQETLAAVAAALLYIEGVVRGLEALPPWIQSIQLALVSRVRIDQILTPTATAGAQLREYTSHLDEDLQLSTLNSATNSLLGLVTDASIEPSEVLSILASGTQPEHWRETLDEHFIRKPGVNKHISFVPEDPTGFNASIREQIQAVSPDLDDSSMRTLLESVGLHEFASSPEGIDSPLGQGAAKLTPDERQRLCLAIALASSPTVLLVGPLIALADSDTALPILKLLRNQNIDRVLVSMRNPAWAHAVDGVLFSTSTSHEVGTHEDLLVALPHYAQIWSHRLNSADIDLSSIGIEPGQEANLLTRMLTERFEAGDFIYRQGSAADRVVFIISGRVEIATDSADGDVHRVAVLGPGNHCGDLRLTVGETRNENAIAAETTITRTLSREAISAGMMGLLDRTPSERRIVASILREGSSTFEELSARLTEFETAELATGIELLVRDGALRESDGRYSVVQKRAIKAGSRALLDKLNFD